MSLEKYHSYNLRQTNTGTAAPNGYQLSRTGGLIRSFTTISGSTTGFVNIYDSNNGLPLSTSGSLGSVVASGVTTATTGTYSFEAELNSGLYIEAVGPVNGVVEWS